MTLPTILRLALLLAPLASAQGALLHVPAPVNGVEELGDARLSVRLVDSAGRTAIAFNASGLATAYSDQSLPVEGLTLELAPQALLAMPGGVQTYYQVDLRWAGGTEHWRIQLADTLLVQEIRDRVGAAAIMTSDLATTMLEEIRVTAESTAADAVATGADADATAFDRAAIEDWHLVHTLFWLSDDALVAPDDVTLWSHGAGQLAGLVCRVVSPPLGGDITFDLLAGDPLVSAYGAGPTPTIVAGDTSTLAGHPEAVPNPITLAAGTPIRLRVLSAPDQNLDGTLPTVGDLPLTVPVGYRILVAADNHVWTRNAYDAVVWTDTGLPAGGEWLGAVATAAALPTATASGSEIWLVTDTARLWQMTNQVDGHVADQASLPAADSVASGAIYVTTDLSEAWQSDGVATWTLLGAAWLDQGQVYLPDTAFTAIASSADLPTAALSGVWYLALDTGHLWRNDAPPWLDSGLLTLFAGAGLRCGLYIYPLPE